MATAQNLWSILRGRFPEREYVLMQEVSNASGFSRINSADYIAVNLWPSRGLAIHGIELKSFRGDWLKELKNPKKQESIFKYCDHFWLLTSDESVAKLDEIPKSWGWLMAKNSTIKTMKEAPALNPIAPDITFVCAMLKRAANREGWTPTSEIEDRIKAAEQMGFDKAKHEKEFRLKELEKLAKDVSEFKEASGIDLFSNWHSNNGITHHDKKVLGAAVKFYLDGGIESHQKEILRIKNSMNHMASKMSNLVNDLQIIETDKEN